MGQPQTPYWTPILDEMARQNGTGQVFGFGALSDTPYSTISVITYPVDWEPIPDVVPAGWVPVSTNTPADWEPVDTSDPPVT
jgi:hypothetical protein